MSDEIWMPGAVRILAHLQDDGPYLAEVQERLRAVYGTDDEKELAQGLPIVEFPVGRATHSSQDATDWCRICGMFATPHAGEPLPLLIQDGDRIMVYDGNHRYAVACIRRQRTMWVRLLTLPPGTEA